ncbi:hypothetical protein DFH06DRAFT_1350768 [Mycena polygramma]|nr:hypothetical protein DFH06DRAFT_1350768 [Mycena polygramma]
MAPHSTDWLSTEIKNQIAAGDLDPKFPYFSLKPKHQPDDICGWDPCPARIFAALTWKPEDNEHTPVWTLKDSKRDGLYPNRKDYEAAFIPGRSWTRKHNNIAEALLDHFGDCQKTHDECLERNIRQAEVRLVELEGGGENSDAVDGDAVFLEELLRAEIELGIQPDEDMDTDAEGDDDEDADTEGEDDDDVLREAQKSLAEIESDLRHAAVELGIVLDADIGL